jgi:hypothetical protein
MKCKVCNSDLEQCPEAGDWFCYQCQIDEYNQEAELVEI